MPVKKRFISWSAVSSKPQAEKISLEEQQITNRRHIEQHDGILVAELEGALASIEPVEVKVMRLEEFVASGLAMLTHDDVRLANAFFRHHVQIWVEHGKVTELRFI